MSVLKKAEAGELGNVIKMSFTRVGLENGNRSSLTVRKLDYIKKHAVKKFNIHAADVMFHPTERILCS